MTIEAVLTGRWLGLWIDLVFVAIGLVFCGIASLSVVGPRLMQWWRARREPGELRMLRAHAEWVRRIGHIAFDTNRPAHPRRAPSRPATWRPAPLFPPGAAGPALPPNRRGKPRPPPVFVPFPDRPR